MYSVKPTMELIRRSVLGVLNLCTTFVFGDFCHQSAWVISIFRYLSLEG